MARWLFSFIFREFSRLRSLGFKVIARENVGEKDMRRAILEFGDSLKDGGVGLFFFAGHAMQVAGRNFLIPIGAEIASERDVELEAVDVARVLARMDEAKNRLNIVILDACRDNPFGRSFRSGSRGLAQIDAPSGTLIAYATAPGRLARDGDLKNGLYTGELLKAIREPGLKLEDVFKRVRQAVRLRTAGEQVPWEASSVEGDFVFAPRAAPLAAAVPTPSRPRFEIKEEARQQFGSLALTSKLDGVEILVGGQRVGETKVGRALVVSNVPVGTQRVVGRKYAHKDWERDVQVAADQRADVSIDIEPLAALRIMKGEDGAEMVLVPAGEFWMGSDESHDNPRRRVYLDAFYIDKYEVSNALHQRFVTATGAPAPSYWDDSPFNGTQQPVVGVGWDDANAYCRWAGKRLPTEAEWEKAARGTDGRRYPWGEEWDDFRATVFSNSGGKTTDVGSRASGASPYGVLDMTGNAFEWVADWYDRDYHKRSPERNPTGPDSGKFRVLRGGYWGSVNGLELWVRSDHRPDFRLKNFGFRCARSFP